MTPALRVVAPGLLTTIQDLGRPGHQHLGIPPSGALDPVSLRAANVLVGNAADTGALEVAYLGPTLAIEADSARIAIVGGEAPMEIHPEGAGFLGARVESRRSIRVRRGDMVRIGSLAGGAVLYVAVEGGFDIAPVLGSVSTYIRGGFGGMDGRALRADDRLPLIRNSASERDEWRLDELDLRPPSRLRVIAGPQSDYFSERAMTRFFAAEYTVGTGSDRMGMRLTGQPIDHERGFNITSDGIAPGSIQVPGNGQPIVLLADRQTTGGYPKIATVISADLPALGRLPIGARIGFEPVTLAAAQTARRALYDAIARLSDRVVPLRPTGSDVAARLYDSNLISGVADAQSSAA